MDSDVQQPEITGFRIVLHNFEGPFDLLLQLISAQKLDVTDVALAQVTDEFVGYVKQLGVSARLDEITEFLVVAATLLDLKAARLVPRGEVDDVADLALLESRDLLFARLLQYRAYRQVADLFAVWQASARLRYPRVVGLEERFVGLLPPVVLGHSAESFAEFAASVFRPRPPEVVEVGHVHKVGVAQVTDEFVGYVKQLGVSVPEQAVRILDMFRLVGPDRWLGFEALTRDCGVSLEVVGRFLALLELYKAQVVVFEQVESLGELKVAWTGVDVDPMVVLAGRWE